MSEFTPGALGFSAIWCVGGPYDGRGYSDMPVMPDGLPAAKVAIPVHGADAHVTYLRRAGMAGDGRWYYDFAPAAQGLIAELPVGTSVGDATSWPGGAVAPAARAQAEAAQAELEFESLAEFEAALMSADEADSDDARRRRYESEAVGIGLPGAAAAAYAAARLESTCRGMADIPPASPWDAETTEYQVHWAVAIATEAHELQVDKTGADYIDHPARVAARFDPATHPIEHCAAWLHNVIEDTGTEADELRGFRIDEDVIRIVELLTRRPGVSKDDYYRAIRQDERAVRVKLADIDDNTAHWRTAQIDPATRERLAAKYARARAILTDDPALREMERPA